MRGVQVVLARGEGDGAARDHARNQALAQALDHLGEDLYEDGCGALEGGRM